MNLTKNNNLNNKITITNKQDHNNAQGISMKQREPYNTRTADLEAQNVRIATAILHYSPLK